MTDSLPSGVANRWARTWQLGVNDGAGTVGGNVALTFDISEAGGEPTGRFGSPGDYSLLKRATGSSDNFVIVPVTSPSVSGDQITFTVAVSQLGSEFTLGATADAPTAVEVQSLAAFSGVSSVAPAGVLALGGLIGLGALTVVVRRKRRKSGYTV